MGFSKYPRPLKDAIRELAETAARQYIPSEITVGDALEHLDEDVIAAWIEREGGYVAALRLVADEIERTLRADHDGSRERALTQSFARGLMPHGATLEVALRHCCAKDLVLDAEIYLANMEPSDAELENRAAREVWDDPVRADQTAMARHLNAGLRAAGLWR